MLKKLKRVLGGRMSSHGGVAQATEPQGVVESVLALPDVGAQVEFLSRCRPFRVDQKVAEFTEFLNRVKSLQPKKILEIGGRRGGSSLLLSVVAPGAEVISMDIDYSRRRLSRLKALCEGRQIDFWTGNSQKNESINRVRDWLGEDPLDVLFIDGDHSYDGAKKDFVNYVPLVRDGGLIAMHDIQQDFRSRFQVNTLAWSGGVPQLWKEIRAAGFQCDDLISNQWQDGYGIGLVTKCPDAAARVTQIGTKAHSSPDARRAA